MNLLYVAGPMTGLPDHNRAAFHAAEADLADAGYAVLNPARWPVRDDWPWVKYLRLGVRDVTYCDGVAVLDGWRHSRGARVEVDVAGRLQIPVLELPTWISRAALQSEWT